MDREGWRAFAKGVKLRESAEGEFAASAGREERKGQGKRSTGFRAKAVCDSPDVALPIHVSHLSVSPILQISQNFANFRGVRLRSFA